MVARTFCSSGIRAQARRLRKSFVGESRPNALAKACLLGYSAVVVAFFDIGGPDNVRYRCFTGPNCSRRILPTRRGGFLCSATGRKR